MDSTDTLSYTDGIIGGGGDLTLPLYADSDVTQSFIISAYTGSITITPNEADMLFDVTNNSVASVTVTQASVIELLHYAGVWRVIFDSSGSGSTGVGSNPAAAILMTPSLSPSNGDIIQSIYYNPGMPERVGDPESPNIWEQVTIPENWGYGDTWTFSDLNTEGVGEHVLLWIIGTDTQWPSTYALVEVDGFTPVELMGSTPVTISCGGAGILQGSVWLGRNDQGDTEGTPGISDENYPATRFEPSGVTESSVSTYWDRTGNLVNKWSQKDVNDWIDSSATTDYTIYAYLPTFTAEDIIGLFGWGGVTSIQYIWDSTNQIKRADPSNETITVISNQPKPQNTVTILNKLGESGFESVYQAVVVQVDGSIDPDNNYLYRTPIPGDAVTSVDGRDGDVDLSDLYKPIDYEPFIPTGRVYDITAPEFGAVAGEDCTDAFDAACAAAELLPGDILVPAPAIAGEAYFIRRPIVLPNNTRLIGQGKSSIITKPDTVATDIIGDVATITQRTIPVDTIAGFQVGDAVCISDVGNYEWNSTHAIITALAEAVDADPATITVDRDLVSPYYSGVIRTQFPLVTNNATPSNDLAPITNGIRVEHLTLDHNAGANDPTDLTLIDFTNSTIHWENGWDFFVNDVHILNAIGDAYSDQARSPGYNEIGAPTENVFANSHIHSSRRHGVHVGSSTSGAQIINNRITDCTYMAMFLCRHAQNTIFTGNRVENCAMGIGGSDVRQGSDDGAVTGSTPLNDIYGDIGTVCVGNVFIGGSRSDGNTTQQAILLAAQGTAVGNNIINWNGGIGTTTNAVDCTITGNTITLAPNYSSSAGIGISAGSHRAKIVGNTIRGGGRAVTATVKQDTGISVDSSDFVSIGYNSIIDTMTGYSFAGSMSNLQIAHNTANMIQDTWGVIRIYGTLTDSNLDVTGISLEDSESSAIISYNDNVAGSAMLGEAAQVRLLVNNIGVNDADDPSTAGDWNAISGQRYDGILVYWNDGSAHVSQYVYGVGWLDLLAGGAGGATGPVGATGATGAQGATGAPGADSIIPGATGATGPAGADSVIPGATGPAGATGAQGATGVQGATGTAGTQGATGPAGNTGAQGSTGATGAGLLIMTSTVPSNSGFSNLGSTSTASTTHQLTAANRRSFVPIYIGTTDTYTRAGVNVTSGATSTWRIGLHSVDANGWPNAAVLYEFGTLDMSGAAGRRDVTISQSITAGWYWAQIQVDSYTATPTVTSINGVSGFPLMPLGFPTDVSNSARFRSSFYDSSGTGTTLGNAPSSLTAAGVNLANDAVRFWIWKA
jgi:hypothetical protein